MVRLGCWLPRSWRAPTRRSGRQPRCVCGSVGCLWLWPYHSLPVYGTILPASSLPAVICRRLCTQVAQRWRFAATPDALKKHGTPQVLPAARLSDLGASLAAKSYQVFMQGGQLYAFKVGPRIKAAWWCVRGVCELVMVVAGPQPTERSPQTSCAPGSP
jgi:hypothetical protein